MSAWNQYVKENYHLVAHLPNKERLKALSEMRSGTRGGAMHSAPKPKKKTGARRKKVKGGEVEGGDFIQDAYDTVKKYTSKGAKLAGSAQSIVNKAKTLADMADRGTDVALSGARAVQRGIDATKSVVGNMMNEAKLAAGDALADMIL
jgi:hypothetical protein